MRNFDLAPLYRATVGFDQIADLMDRVTTTDQSRQSYPPYNIEKTAEDAWRVAIAVAGFSSDELTVELRANELVVTAKKAAEEADKKYLHRGIATRAFERRFQLADHVHVTAASHENGMLSVDLKREVPEALKPRRIAISKAGDENSPKIEAKPVN